MALNGTKYSSGSVKEQINAIQVCRALVKLGNDHSEKSIWNKVGAANCWEEIQTILPVPINYPADLPTAADINFEFFEDRLCGIGSKKNKKKKNEVVAEKDLMR